MAEITRAHDGTFMVGHLLLPFTVRQDGNNAIKVEIGKASAGVPNSAFATVTVAVLPNGDIRVIHISDVESSTIYLGNILEAGGQHQDPAG